MDGIWPMRAHGGLLEMRDAFEIRDGRQKMCDLSADQSLCAGHEIYGQLHQHPARIRIPQPRGKTLAVGNHSTKMKLLLLITYLTEVMAVLTGWCTCRESQALTTWQAPKHTLMTSCILRL